MIPQIKKILYTTDLTKNSTYAFYYAIDLARKHDATITILHCVESLPTAVYSEMLTSETFKTIHRRGCALHAMFFVGYRQYGGGNTYGPPTTRRSH
ncbi:MAG TPA: universal stress protein [Syntrophorhabdaceae bacterium]|nr:universal stress protein [Syntrophorhabdaceae bacterium]